MKVSPVQQKKTGFTLVELLVVIAIMSLMLTLGSNILRSADSTKGLQSTVDVLTTQIDEAREIAKGRATWTRVVFPCDMLDETKDSRTLRYSAILIWEPEDETDLKNYPSGDENEWKMAGQGQMFSQGIYLSPDYSKTNTSYDIATSGKPMSSKTIDARLSRKGLTPCYYLEFDRQGRLTWPRGVTKVVLMAGMNQKGRGIKPFPADKKGRPTQVSGVAVMPNGNTSRIHNSTQIFGDK